MHPDCDCWDRKRKNDPSLLRQQLADTQAKLDASEEAGALAANIAKSFAERDGETIKGLQTELSAMKAKLEAAERENSKDCTGCMYKSRGIDRIYNCDKCARFYSDRFKALTQEDKGDAD
jgi:hypothetical protein